MTSKTKMLSNWFNNSLSLNERLLIKDLQLVYDNNDDRSNVYDLYNKKTISVIYGTELMSNTTLKQKNEDNCSHFEFQISVFLLII